MDRSAGSRFLSGGWPRQPPRNAIYAGPGRPLHPSRASRRDMNERGERLRCGLSQRDAPCASGAFAVVVLEQHRREMPAHVPLVVPICTRAPPISCTRLAVLSNKSRSRKDFEDLRCQITHRTTPAISCNRAALSGTRLGWIPYIWLWDA